MESRTASEVGPFTELMRIVFRKIAIHICLFLGLIGNTITLIILSHKHMKFNSTASYLSALTVFDSLYLIGIFIVNLKTNYPHINETNIYQFILLIIIPFSDFCSNTSTYLTLVFTIERYIAITYPLHARYLCRPSRARICIFIVIIFCFCLTFPTMLETKIEYYTIYDNNNTLFNKTKVRLAEMNIYKNKQLYVFIYFWIIAVLVYFIPIISLIIFNSILIKHVYNISRNKYFNNNNNTLKVKKSFKDGDKKTAIIGSNKQLLNNSNNNNKFIKEICSSNISMRPNNKNNKITQRNLISGLRSKSNSLVNIDVYVNNESNLIRQKQEQTNSISCLHLNVARIPMRVHCSNVTNQNNEQRKGILLLVVIVLVYLISQLPSALLLLHESINPLNSITDRKKRDIIIGINNIANALLYINASLNFVLYSCFSQRFRHIFKKLFCFC